MTARPSHPASTTKDPAAGGAGRSVVAEALAIHAARQKPKAPPKAMPVTPKLPRVRKPTRKPRDPR